MGTFTHVPLRGWVVPPFPPKMKARPRGGYSTALCHCHIACCNFIFVSSEGTQDFVSLVLRDLNDF